MRRHQAAIRTWRQSRGEGRAALPPSSTPSSSSSSPPILLDKAPLRVAVFRRDDQKVYNMVYRDGKTGRLYAKKFKVGGVTRDKEYPLFKTHSRSRIFFFSVHDSEKKNSRVLVHLDPELKRIKQMIIQLLNRL